MASSTRNIYVVIWNLGLSCTMIWMVSSSLCAVLSSASVTRGIKSVLLSCLSTTFVCSRTCLISSNLFHILPLWFSTSSNSYVFRSCTLFATRSTPSSVIVYSGICLWALDFLRTPPICIIGHLGGPVSFGVAVEGVSYVVVFSLPFSSCTGVVSFFHVCASFFGALPIFCYTVFWLGFIVVLVSWVLHCLLQVSWMTLLLPHFPFAFTW
jgi:hypothetical protein